MIRREIVFALALGGCLGAAVASAQDGPAVSAQPTAAPNASASSGDDAIHLHMPVRRHVVHAAPRRESAAPAETPSVDSIGADTTASPAVAAPVSTAEAPPPAQPAPPAKATKSARTPVQPSAPTIPFTFGDDSGAAPPETPGPGASNTREPQAAATIRETKTASLPPKPETPKQIRGAAKPVKAAVEAKADEHAGLTKRGAVLFDKGVSNPSPQQFDGLKLLAGDVSTALESGASRVQLEAYGGPPGDKSSDARRLSLKRALAVRQLLIDSGIPSNRIDVRAMGGAEDKGPDDRVDVYLRAS